MKYLLDKNVLSNNLTKNVTNRDDLCVTEDVLEEAFFTQVEIKNLFAAGVKVLKVSKRHLEKLKEVLANHGDNFKLINLWSGKGTADVVMIAYVLCEKNNPESLFPEDFTIVTKDKELISIASLYGISCIPELT